jgi:GNAT superfamily N-acetyltransferase
MLSIPPAQVTPALRALFDQSAPAYLRCFAVLDGRGTGDILTDDAARPTWGIVRESADGTIYIGGEPDPALVHEAIARLRQTGEVLIGLWDGDDWLTRLPPNPDYVGHTLEWWDRPVGEGLDALIARLPDSLRIDAMDADLFARTDWYASTVAWHGSVERFFQNGGGFCLRLGDQIIGEASYALQQPALAEVGIQIYARFQGKGYGTALAAYTVRACEARGFQTYWNTAKQNLPSAAIARGLGYRTEREYNLLAWFKR